MPAGEISLIVAHDTNSLIGVEGDIPWIGDLRTDMAHFRAKTIGQTVLMGRVTYESLPNGPLPDRNNIVLSRDETYEINGATVVNSISVAIDNWDGETELVVIGGEKVYEAALPDVQRMYITQLDASFTGDQEKYFPTYDDSEWQIIDEIYYDPDNKNAFPFMITELRRKENSFLDLSKTRDKNQLEFYKMIEKAGVCPFEPENLETYYNDLDIMLRGEHWTLTKAGYGYKNADTHLLAIANYHAEYMEDMQPGAGEELLDFMQWFEDEYDIEGGGFAVRTGDIFKTGASVRHLHVHFFKPDEDRPDGEAGKLRFKIV